MTLQQRIDRQDGDIRLSPDEYEGPLVISKPCRIDGQGSTIWSARGPVVVVRARGVVLENLRIETTGGGTDRALQCDAPGTVLRNVEVYGTAAGCDFAERPLDVPRTIDLGVFAAEQRNVFVRHLTLPVPAAVRTSIAGVKVEPVRLPAGRSELQIVTDALRSGTSVYGEIFLDSAVIRRLYVRGRAEAGARAVLETAEGPKAPRHVSGRQNLGVAKPEAERQAADLRKGERRDVADVPCVEVRLDGISSADIDCYVFCLAAGDKVRGDDGLVFFGQKSSPDGAVHLLENGCGASVATKEVPPEIQRIVIAFAAYEGYFPVGGAQVPKVMIAAGSDWFVYPFTNLRDIRTVTALHLYRRGDGWRIWATDHRSREGIEALCKEFGVDVA